MTLAPPPTSSLRGLLSERPTTKMGQIRAVWPHIQAALRAGHTLKAVWERLRADGVDIHYNRLSEYVGRLQRGGSSCSAGLVPAPPQAEKDIAVLPSPPGPKVAHDPAAN